MKFLVLAIGFVSLFSLQAGKSPVQRSVDSMQQLRSLIPERNWEQMFNVTIDESAFEQQFEKEAPLDAYQTTSGQNFFLFATTSGEALRILDLYNQFQFSPYWHIPELLEELREIESKGQDSLIVE